MKKERKGTQMKGKERMLDKNNMTLRLEKMTMLQVSENQMFRNELSKKKSLQERGITLIALVVTIVLNCSYLAME